MMRKTKRIGLLIEALILLAQFFILTPKVLAEDDNQFITVVSPVRISSYNKNPAESLRSEYSVIKKNNLSATWLLTYDALNNAEVASIVKSMDNSQEFGIFLEVTKDFANDSGVVYYNTGFWHHASSVFLSGYTQEERMKLIDSVFMKFKERLGYYPVSVGS